MTSQTETTNFDMNFMDLLRKKFSEEKKAHEETTLQLLTAQAQAQTAEAEATKAQELVAETTLKLDQACEEIKRLRVLTRGGQVQALEAQTKIMDLEAQMAQMRLSEQSQAQTAIEVQEEVRSLRAQAQESQEAHAKTQEFLAQELETAQAKVASLESRMVKARAFFAEIEVETISEPIDQTQELKAKIESLEVQVAQMKLFEHFQAQTEELKAALARITELEAQMAQSEKQAQEKILLLNSDIQDQKSQAEELEAALAQAHEEIQNLRVRTEAQAQELLEAQAKTKDLEAQLAQTAIETQSQAQELQKAQDKICSLEAQIPKPPALAPVKMAEQYSPIRKSSSQWFCIVQNGRRLYFEKMSNCHAFTKFIAKKDATLELAGPEITLTSCFRVIVCDGQDWETIGHIDPENKKILIGRLIWKWVTKCTPARINADGKEEYQLQILIY